MTDGIAALALVQDPENSAIAAAATVLNCGLLEPIDPLLLLLLHRACLQCLNGCMWLHVVLAFIVKKRWSLMHCVQLQAAVAAHAQRTLRACMQYWRCVSDEHTASLFLAEQCLRPRAWRALRAAFCAWSTGVCAIQVGCEHPCCCCCCCCCCCSCKAADAPGAAGGC